jgi:osmotically inducible protein OsmC
VPGIGEDLFRETAEAAKKGCPVSRALAAIPEISVTARLR